MGIFYDFFKAFDSISHQILLKKLERYEIVGIPLQWYYYRGDSDKAAIVTVVALGALPRPVTDFLCAGSSSYSTKNRSVDALFADLLRGGKFISYES